MSLKLVKSVEIVKTRAKGITGYLSVGRGTKYGNPYTGPLAAQLYKEWLLDTENLTGKSVVHSLCLLVLTEREEGLLTIGCTGNCLFKTPKVPCHASVIKEVLERAILIRDKRLESDLSTKLVQRGDEWMLPHWDFAGEVIESFNA